MGSDLFPARSQIGQAVQGSLVRVARSLHQEGTHATRASSLPSKIFQLAIFFRALFVVLLVVLLLLLVNSTVISLVMIPEVLFRFIWFLLTGT